MSDSQSFRRAPEQSAGEPDTPGRFSFPKFPALALALALLCSLAWAATGSGEPVPAMVAVVMKLLTSGWMPLAYLAAAFGYGHVVTRRLLPTMPSRTIAMCVGLALMLSLTHLLGWAGLLGGAAGPFVAWLVVAIGFGLGLKDLAAWWEHAKTAPRPSAWWLVVTPAFGLMLACACSTPGWLWNSEAGGYDALEYHLQLPQEWFMAGRISPERHNVYSYLPSYMEGAYLHLTTLSFPQRTPTEASWGAGLLARDGQGLFAAQLLHTCIGMLASLAIGRATSRLVGRAAEASALRLDDPRLAVSTAGALAAGLFAWTPWTVVVSSLPYNEMVLLLMGAGLIMLLLAGDVPATARWIVAAILVGGACGAKPTALLFLGVPTGIALAAMAFRSTPRTGLAKAATLGIIVGALMVAPWMVRNALDNGNPVFPFAASVFKNAQGGTGHWSAEQVTRFTTAHSFSGPVAERLRLTVLPQSDPGNPKVSVHRGIMHPQWGYFFPIFGLCLLGILPRWQGMTNAGRGATALLFIGVLAQFVLWLFTTHIQSRFLLPMLPACTALAGLGIGLVDARNLRAAACVVLVGAQASTMYNVLAREHELPPPKQGAIPLGAVALGSRVFTAEAYKGDSAVLPELLGPEQWMNLSNIPADARILLVGDVSGLYMRQKVTYATTWDENPLATIMTQKGEDVDAWSKALQDQGYTLVLINLSEIARFQRSGYLDARLAPDHLAGWMQNAAAAQHAWQAAGKVLLKPLTTAELTALRERIKAANQQGAQHQPTSPAAPPNAPPVEPPH